MNKHLLSLGRRAAVAGAAVGLVAGVFAVTTAAAETINVYTATEADSLEEYAAAFNKDVPDVTIKWVRDSTGIITAKLLAEKDNPRADIVWQLAGTSLMLLDARGMLLPYTPKGFGELNDHFKDPGRPPAWTGTDAWIAVVCYNTVEAEKFTLPKPKSWKDLTDPAYKGHLVMPNPASSGTGFLDVSSWLQIFGDEEGWNFMDGLHENMAVYVHSGSKPAKLAAAGEYAIGISYADRCARLKAKGAPVDLIFPEEGVGWEMEATAIIKGTKKLEAAKKLADWAITRQAMEMYNKYYAVVAMPGVARERPHYPKNVVDILIRNDFGWAATNRKRILGEWQKRYDTKSEPKG
jgi:iron(III) transport system substrate-binding protein